MSLTRSLLLPRHHWREGAVLLHPFAAWLGTADLRPLHLPPGVVRHRWRKMFATRPLLGKAHRQPGHPVLF